MPRAFAAALPLLATLALLTPGEAAAGPSEGASGKMVLDEVVDGLRRYRAATNPATRIKWLEKLAPTGDPRVAVELYDFWFDDTAVDFDLRKRALISLACSFARGTRFDDGICISVTEWWTENEADLRRRAAQLPR
jgi:hypothetical protein